MKLDNDQNAISNLPVENSLCRSTNWITFRPHWNYYVDVLSLDICDDDQGKCDDVRSISMMNMVILD
jgi:hypothetical protein